MALDTSPAPSSIQLPQVCQQCGLRLQGRHHKPCSAGHTDPESDQPGLAHRGGRRQSHQVKILREALETCPTSEAGFGEWRLKVELQERKRIRSLAGLQVHRMLPLLSPGPSTCPVKSPVRDQAHSPTPLPPHSSSGAALPGCLSSSLEPLGPLGLSPWLSYPSPHPMPLSLSLTLAITLNCVSSKMALPLSPSSLLGHSPAALRPCGDLTR